MSAAVKAAHSQRLPSTSERLPKSCATRVDKYSWIEIGSSYVVSEFQAAVLLAQLEQANSITAHRLWLWNRYFESLASLEERGLISRPRVPAECSNNAHIFRIMLANEEHRDAIIAQLRADGIGAAFHFVPLHSSQAGKRWGRSIGPMSVTTDASKRLLRLPLYADLKEDDVDFIVGRVIHAIEASTRN
jgi:dTDP-4-amino-4,6-dideoxygalactose transaminase